MIEPLAASLDGYFYFPTAARGGFPSGVGAATVRAADRLRQGHLAGQHTAAEAAHIRSPPRPPDEKTAPTPEYRRPTNPTPPPEGDVPWPTPT